MQPRKLVVALLLSAAPLLVYAQANKPSSPVTIVNDAANPVPVTGAVRITNLPTSTAVSGSVAVTNLPTPAAVNATTAVVFTSYFVEGLVYTNTSSRPVRLTGLSASASGLCTVVALVAGFTVANAGDIVGQPNTAQMMAEFGPQHALPSGDCLASANFAGLNVVVGPGQTVTGLGIANISLPNQLSIRWNLSGYQM